MVTLLGAGSVGSHVGLLLAEMGYGLIAIDQDIVEATNIKAGRTRYTSEMVGTSKAHALARTVKQGGLTVGVHPFHRNIDSFSDDELLALTQGSVAIVAAFDDPGQLVRLNALVYATCVVVYPAFHAGGRSAHVVFTIPGGPCFECALGIASSGDLNTLHGERALPLDIQQLSQITVRVVLALTNPGVRELDGLLDPNRNIIFINNRPFGAEGGELVSSQLEVEPNPHCPVCGPFTDRERR